MFTSPYITLVGGTSLTTVSNGGPWTAETTWNQKAEGVGTSSSSGGISFSYPIPSWQQGIDMSGNGGSTAMRNTPDVALLADGVAVAYNNGQGTAMNGASAAAPLWAGFMALVNQQAAAYGQPPVGFANPAIYAIGRSTNYTACFHDITTGNNTNSYSPTNFFARPGYDLCSGWGTPTGQPLINALATPDLMGITPATGFTAANGPAGPFNVTAQTFALTNGGAVSVDWALGSTSAWLNVSTTAGTLLPGGQAGSVTISLNPTADILPAGVYTASVWFTNLTTGYVQSRQFTLQARQPLLQNGGFETGNFSGWEGLGLWYDSGWDKVSTGTYAHSGTYGAVLRATGAYAPVVFLPGLLEQSVPTVPGQTYRLSFWVRNTGKHPAGFSAFRAAWNGTPMFDRVASSTYDWANVTFVATATQPSTRLQFGWLGNFYLDDISLTPVSNVPPAILSQPSAGAFPIGSPAGFQVNLVGTWPLRYQWQFNGANLADNPHVSGANSNVLSLTSANYGDVGNYSVVITNAYGAVTSTVASLTLLGSNLLVNGSFVSPALAADTVVTNVPTGWSGMTFILNGNPYAGNVGSQPSVPPLYVASGPPPEDGQQCVDLKGGGPTQQFNLATSGLYRVSWFDNTPIGGAFASSYTTILLDNSGQSVTTTVWDASNLLSVQGPIWRNRAVMVYLTPGSYRLTFAKQAEFRLDTLLDNVEVRPVVGAARPCCRRRNP